MGVVLDEIQEIVKTEETTFPYRSHKFNETQQFRVSPHNTLNTY